MTPGDTEADGAACEQGEGLPLRHSRSVTCGGELA
jgi:hypothetical protein